MTSVVIPDLDDEDLARIDRRAVQRGMSREAYLRDMVRRDLRRAPLSRADFTKFAGLGDEQLMRDAWS